MDNPDSGVTPVPTWAEIDATIEVATALGGKVLSFAHLPRPIEYKLPLSNGTERNMPASTQGCGHEGVAFTAPSPPIKGDAPSNRVTLCTVCDAACLTPRFAP